MVQRRKAILWLDEYFDDPGEVARSVDFQSISEIKAGPGNLARRFPESEIISRQTVRGFVGSLLDYARFKSGSPLASRWEHGDLSAILIDIMIDGLRAFDVPRIDQASREILFKDNGLVDDWDIIKTQDFNVGLFVAHHFVRQVSLFDAIPIIFYTNRVVNRELEAQIADLPFADKTTNVPASKVGGLSGLEKLLKEFMK